jgi:dihydropteroate synthase
MRWTCGARNFDLERRVLVMGVINLTPDSFSDGGRFTDPATALAHARTLIDEGADLLDLGAESTRPGSSRVPADEQWRRLEPVLHALAAEGRACISVDTASARVASLAIEAGAEVINDVTALGDPEMAGVLARSRAGVVLMHMLGTPATMQSDPRYEDCAREVASFLAGRLEQAERAGIAPLRVALDPGIGFGKTVRHNLELIARLQEIAALGRPVMVGASRKGFLGSLLDLPVDQRLEGGLAAHAVAVFQGARIVRTHDVAATSRAVRVALALAGAGRGSGS